MRSRSKHSKARVEVWDFFIAHAGADREAAECLANALRVTKRVRVYLDSHAMTGGNLWQSDLKEALSASRVSVVLISRHTPRAWYQQEEVVLAIELARDKYAAHTIVPVYLNGSRKADTPYGLSRLHALRESPGPAGRRAVTDGLIQALKKQRRSGTRALAGSVRSMDELWSETEVAFNGGSGIPKQFRRTFTLDDDDFVARDSGRELKRITRQGLRRKLGVESMEYIEVLERSMEVNLALWKQTHPRRVVSARDRKKARDAVAAMSGDLRSVLDTITSAGFKLDDHYETIHRVVDPASPAGG